MIGINMNFDFMMKLVLFILLPIVVVVLIGLFMIQHYSKKFKDKNTALYNYTMDYYSSLLAMVIVGILIAIVLGFSLSFTYTMRMENIVTGNEMIYYVLMFTPLVPVIFFLYYLRNFISASSGRKRSIAHESEKIYE